MPSSVGCTTGKNLHMGHAQTARRANLPQGGALAPSGIFSRIPPRPGGAYALSSRNVRRECDGHNDSSAQSLRGRLVSMRTEKSCGPDTPTLASSWREMISLAMGANKPGPQGARRTPLKPSRREGRVFGQTCGDCRLLFVLQAGHGRGQRPAFPAPSNRWRETDARLGRCAAAGMIAFVGCDPTNSLKTPYTRRRSQSSRPYDRTTHCSSDRPRCRRNRWARRSGAAGYAASRWRRTCRWP